MEYANEAIRGGAFRLEMFPLVLFQLSFLLLADKFTTRVVKVSASRNNRRPLATICRQNGVWNTWRFTQPPHFQGQNYFFKNEIQINI